MNESLLTPTLEHLRCVEQPIINEGQRPRELAHNATSSIKLYGIAADPEYTLYNSRLTPKKLDTATDDEMLAVRTIVIRHTGELPIEISGPDVENAEQGFHPEYQQGETGPLFVSICLLP